MDHSSSKGSATEIVLRGRSVKKSSSPEGRKPATTTSSSTAARPGASTSFAKPENLSTRRRVPSIAVSMRQTLSDNNNVVITPPLGQQLVENSYTFNSPRARTSTMKRDSLSPSLANPPELSPIRRAPIEAVGGAPVSEALLRPEPKVKDKSSKRKSNLNIAFNEELTGTVN